MYNMYALARNSWKYGDRDKRTDKTQFLEFNFLAPDTINEMANAIVLMEELTGRAFINKGGNHKNTSKEELISIGKKMLEKGDATTDHLEITASGFENSTRHVKLIKLPEAYRLFKELLNFYAGEQLLAIMQSNKIDTIESLKALMPGKLIRSQWANIGGQLILQAELDKLLKKISTGKIKSWNEIHGFYQQQGKQYALDKFFHAAATLKEVNGIDLKKLTLDSLHAFLLKSVTTKEWMVNGIYESRAKDYTNEFRKMVYDTTEEMNTVIGDLDKNVFIRQEMDALAEYKKKVQSVIRKTKSPSRKSRQVSA